MIPSPPIQNQQLFSEAYVREVRTHAASREAVSACQQTVREWREEYADLTSLPAAAAYVRQVLSALGVSYAPLPTAEPGFYLLGDGGPGDPTGLCWVVAEEDLGRATKGRHPQLLLIRRLREAHLSWGVLTNGAQWRLCFAGATAPYEVFFEADVDRLLNTDTREDFAVFFHFFGRDAFAPVPASARIGLDTFLAASEKRTEAIEKHLKGRIESLLQTLCLGFVKDEAAGNYSRETLDTIYQNSIYLLYRLLFLFYAEARTLLPMDLPAYAAVSLASLLADARRASQEGLFPADPHAFWKRLRHLFAVVDYGDPSVGVAAYNGGLFSDAEKPYLKDHHLANEFLAPALFALGFEATKTGFQPIHYRDLSVRHLGTLYEGLLEYRLNLVQQEPVVVREAGGKRVFLPESLAQPVKKSETVLPVGEVYFADDKGERKSSGSYYTPEDVVQYIVENTVTPKLHERRAALDAFLDELRREYEIAPTDEARAQIAAYADGRTLETVQQDLLSLRVLDPAMGSGHFLVAAGQAMTNFLVETLNSTPWANDALSTDPLLWKRRVVERCLYGVDKNRLAQELAKLALWISSASAGKPLTFLDHHLKCGNSLYGAPLRRLSLLPASKSTRSNNLFGELSETVLRDLTAQIGLITRVDSDHIDDVKAKGESHRRAQDLTRRLADLAHVWLASLFTLTGDAGKPLTDDHYDYLLNLATQNRAAESWEALVRSNPILSAARMIADENEFFHWELEFPDAVTDGACRFDAVVANPPYVGTKADRAITALYETARCGDLYAWIMEKALDVTERYGNVGIIVPLSLTFSRQFSSLRDIFLKRSGQHRFANFDNNPDAIFPTTPGSRNSQRATIILTQAVTVDEIQLESTDLLRWTREDRVSLLNNLNYANITRLASSSSLPKIGNPALSEFLARMKCSPRTINDLCSTMLSEGQKDYDAPYFLVVPRAVRYFLSAIPEHIDRSKVLTLTFSDQLSRDMCGLLLNSNINYWYWLSYGDGFCTNIDTTASFPVPLLPEREVNSLAVRLFESINECRTGHNTSSGTIPNVNFNKRMDILLDIDEWIVKHVAPDLNLPRDIFAQYKSNSFLKPIDVFAITNLETDQPENTE